MSEASELREYFERFFDEKDLDTVTWEFEKDGLTHFVDSDHVIELIKSAPVTEQRKIRHTLVQIDFVNGDVLHYLKHLANGYIQTCW